MKDNLRRVPLPCLFEKVEKFYVRVCPFLPLSAVIKNHRIFYIIFIKSSVFIERRSDFKTNRAEREGEKERNEE